MPGPMAPMAVPMPSARFCAASLTLPSSGMDRVSSWSVIRFGGHADVDAGKQSEDERLQVGDEHELEAVEEHPHRDAQYRHEDVPDDDDQRDAHQDQQVACQHVRKQPDAERDQSQQ